VGVGESLALSATVGIQVTARRGAPRDTIVSTTTGTSELDAIEAVGS